MNNLKGMLKVMAGIVLLAAMGGIGRSHATTAYTNSALNGCYGYLLTSVDTEAPPRDRNVVGTMCFDGNGNIVPIIGGVDQTGGIMNTNGVVAGKALITGTYAVTDVPGQGMGTFIYTNVNCAGEYAFSINSVDSNGLAHGFQFALIKKGVGPGCGKGPHVMGGTAYLQP
jgi:hypothetical protein